MIATFFNKTKPFITISLFLLLAVGCFFITFFQNPITYSLFWEGFVFYILIAFVLYMLIFTIKRHKLTLNNSYAALFYLFILLLFTENIVPLNQMISLSLLSVVFYKTYTLYRPINSQKNIFDAGFWLGVAFLFHFWVIVFIALIYMSIFRNKKNSLKNLLTPIIAFVIPPFLLFTYHFYFDSLLAFYKIFPSELSFSTQSYFEFPILISSIFILSLLLLSLFVIYPKALSIGKKFSNFWEILLFHFLLGVLVIGFSSEKNNESIVFLIFPTAIIIAILLQNIRKKMIREVIVYLSIFLILFRFLI